MIGQSWPLVRWVVSVQAGLTGAAAILIGLWAGPLKAGMVLMGGAIAVFLGLVFALRAFSVDASVDPEGALRALRRGVAAKMIGAVVIFGLAAKWMPQHVAQLIIGFAAATISYWLALLKAPLGAPAGHNEGKQS